MVSFRTTLSPLLRSLAGAMLLVWMTALAFCSAECFLGDSHCQPTHHDEQATTSHHHHDEAPDSEKHDGCDNSFCDSLQTIVHTASGNHLFKPDFGLAYILDFAPSQISTIPQAEAQISRQPPDRKWVFTPEVYLGPAFRSHAPPVLA